jgi:hypothetical protein
MGNVIKMSIKGRSFKSIGEEAVGFEEIYPINIIIGRNNVGKSTLLDLIQRMIQPGDMPSHKGNPSEILLTKPVSREEIVATFPDNRSGGNIPRNHLEHGLKWIDSPLTVRLIHNSDLQFVSIEPELSPGEEYRERLGKVFQNHFHGKLFRRIRADRDIGPEIHGGVDVLENGLGTTNLVQIFYNDSTRDRTLVTEKLLEALNKIFSPDLTFQEIVVSRNPNDNFEIYLREENKGLIRLSDSGSGLKTVILVLVNLLLIPAYTGEPLSKYVFAFEELENNLHPGLQRKLFNYIREVASNESSFFFITTHSNIVIDLFNKDEEAQIIHVTHNGEFSTARKVITYIENRGILDDLDVRASDLLQANGIVWVEGPSDRLYFNRWVELWSEGELREGIHYQCVFYGGRLLSHLTALAEEAEGENNIDILKVNKNGILMLDSDKISENDELNDTKNRLISEIGSIEGYSWTTYGRTIENYIPQEAINTTFNSTEYKLVPTFLKFEEHLEKIKVNEGVKFLKNKVLFAEKILPSLTKANIQEVLDMRERMDEVCSRIKTWNSIT